MDLFDYMRKTNQENDSPLAMRLRPRTLEEVVGQQHIVGKDKLLYRAIKADKLSSIIFYGPPGTGKTTLAKVIANTTSADFCQINATVAGKKEMEDVVERAKNNLGMYGKKTILFVDEIHRFNKGQQDYLLPFVEDGTIVLVGATTENPYYNAEGSAQSYPTVGDALYSMVKANGTSFTQNGGYVDSITTSDGTKIAAYSSEDWTSYYGWNYCVYRNGVKVSDGDILSASVLEVKPGDNVYWAFGTYDQAAAYFAKCK